MRCCNIAVAQICEPHVTLEEINERGKESFMDAGGESYTMIPCLNTNPLWVNVLRNWVKDFEAGSEEMVLDLRMSDL